MDEKTALHTAARRFCMARHAQWWEQYRELERAGKSQVKDPRSSAGWNYSVAAFALFPCYRLDDEILAEVEFLVPASCTSPVELGQALSNAAERGFVKLEGEFQGNPVAISALRNELAAFLGYVADVAGEDLSRVEPLLFRRVLAASESDHLWRLLAERWGVGKEPSWFPLNERTPPENAIAFHKELWDARGGTSLLLGSIAEHGIERCYVLREFGPPDYELERSAVDPYVDAYHDGGEAYITSDGEWLLYSSHESSITVAGWLADYFRRQWPDADKVTYNGPFHTDDLKGTWES